MAKVKMLVDISGTSNGKTWPKRGETVDLPQSKADDLVAAGLAEAVGPAPKEKRTAETAAAPKPETASRKGKGGLTKKSTGLA